MGAGVRTGAIIGAALFALAACSSDGSTVLVRSADDVQVLSPEEVAALRATATTLAARPTTTVGATSPQDSVAPNGPTTTAASGDTVPQNVDDRPPELRLFEAFGEFRSCLEDDGYVIEGDLLDPNNPAFQDPDYVAALQKCAARSDIITVLQEVQATRADLTPDEVEQRNEVFKELQACLEDKGWTVETRTSEIGLIEPVVFVGPEGSLDERDINQCLTEQGIGG